MEGVKLAHIAASEADLILFVVDLGRPIEASNPDILDTIAEPAKLLVANKADLEPRFEPAEFAHKMGLPLAVTSAITGDGLDLLAERIERALVGDAADQPLEEGVVFIDDLGRDLRRLLNADLSGEEKPIQCLSHWVSEEELT